MSCFDFDLAHHLHQTLLRHGRSIIEVAGHFVDQMRGLDNIPLLLMRPTSFTHILPTPYTLYPSTYVERSIPRLFSVPIPSASYGFESEPTRISRAQKPMSKLRHVHHSSKSPGRISRSLPVRPPKDVRTRQGAVQAILWAQGPSSNTRGKAARQAGGL